ncbi:hypothetical protein MKX03_012137 [Papaver bracteatum]|nr:hypothetical protein MKX03_012137 [Papaver bracteatum]
MCYNCILPYKRTLREGKEGGRFSATREYIVTSVSKHGGSEICTYTTQVTRLYKDKEHAEVEFTVINYREVWSLSVTQPSEVQTLFFHDAVNNQIVQTKYCVAAASFLEERAPAREVSMD